MLCVSHIPGEAGLSPGVQGHRPVSKPLSLPQGPGAKRAEAEIVRLCNRGAAPERIPQALLKFVNSRGGGRAPLRTSERRAEEGRGPKGGAGDSPDAAKRPGAQSNTPHSAASAPESCMLRDAGKNTRTGAGTRGLLRTLRSRWNKSVSRLRPLAHVLRPGQPQADSGRSSGTTERRGRTEVGVQCLRLPPSHAQHPAARGQVPLLEWTRPGKIAQEEFKR